MQRALSIEQSPPLGAVLRFFLSTPLFVMAAGLLLLWQGEAAFATRWSPGALAATHLFTLGALGMSMAGALIQILPVVAATEVPHTRAMAPAVHALLAGGTVLLACGFMLGAPMAFQGALLLLVPGLLWLAGSLAVALWRPQPPGALDMVGTVRLALGALVVTVTLGALLAASFAWPKAAALPLLLLADLHAGWGVFGWGGLLLAGVAYQVVPMFQVTPLYAGLLPRTLGVLAFLLLVLWSVVSVVLRATPHFLPWLGAALVLVCFAVFAGATLRLLALRKREPDAMTLFWRLSMACLLACLLLWMVPESVAGSGRTLALGVLAIGGFLYSTVNGMLYKIVPFLVWHHAADGLAGSGIKLPNVKNLIPDEVARRQLWLHGAAMAVLVAACWWPAQLARPGAALLAASGALLTYNLWRAARLAWAVPAPK